MEAAVPPGDELGFGDGNVTVRHGRLGHSHDSHTGHHHGLQTFVLLFVLIASQVGL